MARRYDAFYYRLTPYQVRLCGMISLGHSDREIADTVSKAVNAIQQSVHVILKSTGCRSRTEVAIWYIRYQDMLELEESRLG